MSDNKGESVRESYPAAANATGQSDAGSTNTTPASGGATDTTQTGATPSGNNRGDRPAGNNRGD